MGADERVDRSRLLYERALADHADGRLEEARRRLEESSGLRREIGFLPGVASNMVGLIYIAAGQGRHDDALALLDEAKTIAEASGARAIMRQVEEARAAIGSHSR
jgi:tetratricopeptide (TPR) repeat protein